MKVWIDQDLCTGDGLCEEICPAVFTLLDDGLAYVKQGDAVHERARWLPQMADVASDLEDAVTEAAEECPGECIFIELTTDALGRHRRGLADLPERAIGSRDRAVSQSSGTPCEPPCGGRAGPSALRCARFAAAPRTSRRWRTCSAPASARSSAVWLIVGRYAEQDPAGCAAPARRGPRPATARAGRAPPGRALPRRSRDRRRAPSTA